jgi:hypothetical protein
VQLKSFIIFCAVNIEYKMKIAIDIGTDLLIVAFVICSALLSEN